MAIEVEKRHRRRAVPEPTEEAQSDKLNLGLRGLPHETLLDIKAIIVLFAHRSHYFGEAV